MTSHSPSEESRAEQTQRGEAGFAIDIRRWPGIRKLAADYAYNFAGVSAFFNGNPADDQAWRTAIDRAQRQPRPHARVAHLIAEQQARRHAPAAARRAAEALADRHTVAVVTGQQAGLFGGPLFTLLKALTALTLAERVSRTHGVKAVALFWIDAEDHDWDEVRQVTVFDQALAARTLGLPARIGGASAPVAHTCLDHTVEMALAELRQTLAPTEFTESVFTDLAAAYAPGVTMPEAFGRWMERVLGDRGLIVFDSSDPQAKPLAASVFARELSTPGETVRLAKIAGASLVAGGYHAQVQSQDEAIALFHLDGGRRPIKRVDGHLQLGDARHTESESAALALAQPTLFSPNVLLRPVVQDTLFPTICYVAGPNELAYLGQLRGIYDRFGVPMPLMYPRGSATIADAATLRFLHKYDVSLAALQAQDDTVLNRLLAEQIPSSVDASFSQAERAVDEGMQHLAQAIAIIDPTLEGATRSTLGKMQHDLSTLRSKMIQAAKRRDDTLRRQFARARALTFPDGHAQERAIGFVSFLNQYGPALIDRLEQQLPLDLGHHWVVTI